MLNLKKTAVAVLAFGSSAVFAGSMGPVCSAVNVTVPCESTAWSFGAKALYLQTSVNNGIGASETLLARTVGQQSYIDDNANKYNWGFQIEGSYHFNTGNDLNINWYHLSNSRSKSFGDSAPVASFLNAGSTVAGRGGNISVDPKWDAVNFEFGQHVDFGDFKAIRFHGGAQYARLTNDVDANWGTLTTNGVTGQSTSYSADYEPTFNGFGPRVGMDLSYDWGNGLGIYANGATAILAGTRSFNSSFSQTVEAATGSLAFHNSSTVVVPVVDAKLGATYTYAMAQGDLTLDAGWMWVNYFNVHANALGTNNDFGLQGPFIGLKWMGNVA